MVKNARSKRAAREYQVAHPGMSHVQATCESCAEHERTRPPDEAAPHADDAPRTVVQPLSSNYLTNPFSPWHDDDGDEQR